MNQLNYETPSVPICPLERELFNWQNNINCYLLRNYQNITHHVFTRILHLGGKVIVAYKYCLDFGGIPINLTEIRAIWENFLP